MEPSVTYIISIFNNHLNKNVHLKGSASTNVTIYTSKNQSTLTFKNHPKNKPDNIQTTSSTYKLYDNYNSEP